MGKALSKGFIVLGQPKGAGPALIKITTEYRPMAIYVRRFRWSLANRRCLTAVIPAKKAKLARAGIHPSARFQAAAKSSGPIAPSLKLKNGF